MKDKLRIRLETVHDRETISKIIDSAFFGKQYSGGNEAAIVDELRRAGDLSLSLVADLEDVPVGHIAFSPAHLSEGIGRWYALGPLAVSPMYQRGGIGTALVTKGLDIIESMEADGCILTGALRYYSRFGFEHSPQNAPVGEPAAHFMIRRFRGDVPNGPIHFHDAFHPNA